MRKGQTPKGKSLSATSPVQAAGTLEGKEPQGTHGPGKGAQLPTLPAMLMPLAFPSPSSLALGASPPSSPSVGSPSSLSAPPPTSHTPCPAPSHGALGSSRQRRQKGRNKGGNCQATWSVRVTAGMEVRPGWTVRGRRASMREPRSSHVDHTPSSQPPPGPRTSGQAPLSPPPLRLSHSLGVAPWRAESFLPTRVCKHRDGKC